MKKLISIALLLVAGVSLATVTIPTTLDTAKQYPDNKARVNFQTILGLSRTCHGCPMSQSVTPIAVNPTSGAMLVNTDTPGVTFWTESNSAAMLSSLTTIVASVTTFITSQEAANAALFASTTTFATANLAANASLFASTTTFATANLAASASALSYSTTYTAAMFGSVTTFVTAQNASMARLELAIPSATLALGGYVRPCATCY